MTRSRLYPWAAWLPVEWLAAVLALGVVWTADRLTCAHEGVWVVEHWQGGRQLVYYPARGPVRPLARGRLTGAAGCQTIGRPHGKGPPIHAPHD
jgi:hypothetical protein